MSDNKPSVEEGEAAKAPSKKSKAPKSVPGVGLDIGTMNLVAARRTGKGVETVTSLRIHPEPAATPPESPGWSPMLRSRQTSQFLALQFPFRIFVFGSMNLRR